MFNPFAYLRERAREAVLAGVHDALTQIDPAAAPLPPQVTTPAVPALAAGPTPPEPPAPPSGGPDPGPGGGSIQERLARAAGADAPPQLPPAPSAPRRGRGRPPQGDEA